MQTFTHLGDVVDDGNQASICSNGRNQLFVASGGYAYVFDLTRSALQPVIG